jgi:hypothetical protein
MPTPPANTSTGNSLSLPTTRTPTYLPTLINECVQSLRSNSTNSIPVHACFDSGFPEVARLDRHRTRTLLGTLISAAARISPESELQLRVSGTPVSSTLRFEVRDSVIGYHDLANLPPSSNRLTRSALSDPSAIAELAAVRTLAADLGGSLEFSCVPGVGNAFAVQIAAPAAVLDHDEEEVASPMAVAARLEPKILSDLHVLVVDDDDLSRRLLQSILLNTGAAVTTALSGEEAILLATRTLFDVILMDMELPAMDGRETTRSLLTRGCTAPIIAMTAHNEDSHRDECMRSGSAAYFTKPINTAALLKVLAQIATQARAAANVRRAA